MRFVALLFALAVGGLATVYIVQTGQFSQPVPGAPDAQAEAAPAAPGAEPTASVPEAGSVPDAGTTPESPGAAQPAAAPAPQTVVGSTLQGFKGVGSATAGNANAVAAVVPQPARGARAAAPVTPKVLAASAAKSPKTVSASLMTSPKPAPAPAAPPAVRIRPPQGLEGVAFGASAQQIAARFPPSWRRETKDELTLVYYPNKQGDQVRFHFSAQGLTRLELQLKPPQGMKLNEFYAALRERYAAAYASLRSSGDGAWNDGVTVIQVTLIPTSVSVVYRPQN